MGQLFFKKALQIAILEGRKQTTLRRWSRPMLHAGGRAYSLGLGWLSIDAVDQVDLAQLEDHDARADGFSSRTELLATLHELYPDAATDGKAWYRIAFTLRGQTKPRAKKRGGAPHSRRRTPA